MHEVLVNHLGGLRLPRKSVVRLTDRPDMTLDVYSGRKKTTTTPFPPFVNYFFDFCLFFFFLLYLAHFVWLSIIK